MERSVLMYIYVFNYHIYGLQTRMSSTDLSPALNMYFQIYTYLEIQWAQFQATTIKQISQ